MKKIIALAGALALMAGSAIVLGGTVAQAQAQMPCAPYKEVVDGLKRNHDELPAGLGDAGDGMALLLFRTPSGSTWTLVIVRPDGVACMVADGQSWSDIVVGDPA